MGRRAVAPIGEEVATSYEGKLKVLKLNVDQNSQTPARYGIRGIPALLFFKDGKLATLDMAAPQGADNVDDWSLMANSFLWK